MADEPKGLLDVKSLPSRQGEVSAIASTTAPFLYFEVARNFGFRDGIANIALEAHRHVSVSDQQVLTDRVIVAHLRMPYTALQTLKAAINGIELMVIKPAEKSQSN
jgi:hypothetical protein